MGGGRGGGGREVVCSALNGLSGSSKTPPTHPLTHPSTHACVLRSAHLPKRAAAQAPGRTVSAAQKLDLVRLDEAVTPAGIFSQRQHRGQARAADLQVGWWVGRWVHVGVGGG